MELSILSPKLLKGKILLLGIGNALRRDDAFGSVLACQLKDKVSFDVIDAGSSPENFLGEIIKRKPATLLLVDAVDFGGEAAELRLFDMNELNTVNFFLTHDTSPKLLFDFLKQEMKGEAYLLAVQPKDTGFGEGMSREIVLRLEEVKARFIGDYPKRDS